MGSIVLSRANEEILAKEEVVLSPLDFAKLTERGLMIPLGHFQGMKRIGVAIFSECTILNRPRAKYVLFRMSSSAPPLWRDALIREYGKDIFFFADETPVFKWAVIWVNKFRPARNPQNFLHDVANKLANTIASAYR